MTDPNRATDDAYIDTVTVLLAMRDRHRAARRARRINRLRGTR